MEKLSEQLTMPSGATRSRFDVAIPGQSLTKEPKGYPWESPPMFTTPDEFMEYYFDRFENDEILFGLFALLESKVPVTTIVNSMILHGFSEGMYSPDLGLIMAEELGMLIMTIAEEAGIDYEIGGKDGTREAIKSAAELKKSFKEREEAFMPEVQERIEEIKESRASGGLMAPMETE